MQALWEEKLEASDTAEVHWSTGTILAIFFAASLVSAVFFGLGYSFGRGGTTKPVVGPAVSGAATAAGNTSRSSASASVPDRQIQRPTNAIGTSVAHQGNYNTKSMHAAQAIVAPAKANKPTTKASAGTATNADASASEGSSSYMVQVGAIGDRKDARLLVSKLRKRGFHAGIYPSKHDKFLHVQIGPFSTTEQAQTMRHRVVASGYHAIVKHAS